MPWYMYLLSRSDGKEEVAALHGSIHVGGNAHLRHFVAQIIIACWSAYHNVLVFRLKGWSSRAVSQKTWMSTDSKKQTSSSSACECGHLACCRQNVQTFASL